MTIDGGEIVERIVNRQFQMIGETITFKDIPNDGEVVKDGKRMMWYHCYKLTSEQEEEWRKWTWEQLAMLGEERPRAFYHINMLYGMTVRYKKQGLLF